MINYNVYLLVPGDFCHILEHLSMLTHVCHSITIHLFWKYIFGFLSNPFLNLQFWSCDTGKTGHFMLQNYLPFITCKVFSYRDIFALISFSKWLATSLAAEMMSMFQTEEFYNQEQCFNISACTLKFCTPILGKVYKFGKLNQQGLYKCISKHGIPSAIFRITSQT